MLDLGMIMYGGLLMLVVWRSLCFYRCCGVWLSVFNPASLLYVLLVVSLAYSLVSFYRFNQVPLDASADAAGLWSVPWLRNFVLLSPVAICLTVVLCWFHTEGHVFEIHKDLGRVKHDRAVQIIALPAVFGVMALAAMVPILELVTGNADTSMLSAPWALDLQRLRQWAGMAPEADPLAQGAAAGAAVAAATGAPPPPWEDLLRAAQWRYETCFYVADLFEAWALYQFGKLALELIGESFAKSDPARPASESRSVEPRAEEARLEAGDQKRPAESAAMRDLLASHAAVTSLTWLGMVTFVVVCVAQTACSLWPYFGGSAESVKGIMFQFQVAGFVASSAAIYNVVVVEQAFHHHLAGCSPMLKFLSVKILVSLSFFQRGLLVLLHTLNEMLPDVVKRIVGYVPLVGDIVNLTEVQLHLFYPALILFECLLTCIMHLWAWRANEDWYEPSLEDEERQPLLLEAKAMPPPVVQG